MLIDRFLPRYDVSARYHVHVHAPVGSVYSAARFLDMRGSRTIRWLYRLRGLPADGLTLDGMLAWGFVLLADKPLQEIVFGLIGRFWTPSAQVQLIKADTFTAYNRVGFAKAAGNIAFIPQGDGSVRVETETRVFCPDDTSRRCFRLYWLLIGPFSGIVRHQWLRIIKRKAEALPSRSTGKS